MATLKMDLGNNCLQVLKLLLPICILNFWVCNPKISHSIKNGPCINIAKTNCDSIGFIRIKAPGFPNDEYKLPIKCNQVIFNPGDDKAYKDLVSEYLVNLCFERVFSCPCKPSFELWENKAAEGIDVGVVVAGSPRSGAGGSDVGLLPNIWIESPEPNVNIDLIDTIYQDKHPSCDLTQNKIKIAIIDTGIDSMINRDAYSSHLSQLPDLQMLWTNYHSFNLSCAPSENRRNKNGIRFSNSIFNNSPSDYNSHGTAIHGVITGNSSINFGSNHISKILNVKTSLGKTKSSFLFDNLCAINYSAKQGAEIINLSWGFKYVIGSDNDKITNGLFSAFDKVLHSHQNILFVAAAGNDSMELTANNLFLPASLSSMHNNLISVGAMKWDGSNARLCSFSNYADASLNMVNVYAPGFNILIPYRMSSQGSNPFLASSLNLSVLPWQTNMNRPIIIKSGTSLAAPYIVRLAATLKAINPSLSPHELKSKIISGARLVTETPLIRNRPFKYVIINDDDDDICRYLR